MSRRVEVEVPLARVLIDRLPLQPKTLEYANAMLAGAAFPAIKCALRPDGRLEIRDGRHRWLAAKLAGRMTILARFSLRVLRALSDGTCDSSDDRGRDRCCRRCTHAREDSACD